VLTAVGSVLAAVAIWLRTSLLDTDAFVDIVTPTLTSPEVATAIGDRVGDEVVAALDLQARLESGLGSVDSFLSDGLADALDLGPAARGLLGRVDVPGLANLAAPLTNGVEDGIRSAIADFVESTEFQTLLTDAIAPAHTAAVALLQDSDSQANNLSIVDGEVRWNLVPAVAAALNHVVEQGLTDFGLTQINVPTLPEDGSAQEAVTALSSAVGIDLPPDFGQVTVMSANRLESWQAAVRILDRSVWVLSIVSVLLLVAALAVSTHRRRTLVQASFGIGLGVLLSGVVQRNVIDAVEEAIADPTASQAARVVADELFGSLQRVTLSLLATAVIIGVVAHIAGSPRWLESSSEWSKGLLAGSGRASTVDALVAEHPDGFAVLGFGAALLVWFLVGVGLVTLLIVGGLLGLYLGYISLARRRARPSATGETEA